MIKLLIHAVRGNGALRLQEKVDEAAKTLAARRGESEVSRYMMQFFMDRADNIDPVDDWWGYAQARQKQEDHMQDLRINQRRVEECWARLEALTEQLKKLQENQ